MIDIKTVLVGTDAEVPIALKSGEFFPVTGLVGGSKDAPRPLGRLGKGYAVQEDNVNAEFNIPPQRTSRDFANAIHRALVEVEKLLPPTMRLVHQASMNYHAALLDNPDCARFGCQPDYCAYKPDEENPLPRAKDPTFRTAAAHVHVGWKDPNDADRIQLIKMLDLTLGLQYLEYDDTRRRELYGKAGAFRPKEYGVEYRTLGNFWIRDWSQTIFDGVITAVDFVNRGIVLTPKEETSVVTAINNGKRSVESLQVLARHGLAIR